MAVIKINSKAHPISEDVGDYIDNLVDQKNSNLKAFEGIKKITEEWLKSEHNIIDKSVERVGFSLIEDIATNELTR